jgi:hypothetical protein
MDRHSTFARLLKMVVLSCLLVLCLSASQAQARRIYVYYYNAPEKAGGFMMNFRFGPSFWLQNPNYDYADARIHGSFALDLGFAVTPDRNGYLVLSPQMQGRPGFVNVGVPFGFQYDIRIVRGFYLYPRVALGYGAMIYHGTYRYGPFTYSDTLVDHGGMFIPEFGLKWVIRGSFNIGFEPFSLPVWFNGNYYSVWYRFMFFLGFNA